METNSMLRGSTGWKVTVTLLHASPPASHENDSSLPAKLNSSVPVLQANGTSKRKLSLRIERCGPGRILICPPTLLLGIVPRVSPLTVAFAVSEAEAEIGSAESVLT